MSDLKQKIDDLESDLENIKKSLDLEQVEAEVKKLEAESTDPAFWDDQENAKEVMQKLGDLKEKIKEADRVEKLKGEVQAAIDLGMDNDAEKLIEELEEIIESLKIESFLSGSHDKKNALVSIHAGQGGTEAMDWVSMLYRMYLKFFERRGWKTEVLDENPGEEAGLKNVTIEVQGQCAYGYLKNEAGTHRLVRQSPFNADQKRETSFALVEVMPELEEVDLPDIKIKDDDLDWQFFRASSQGGQNVQKVSTAVRLIHKPTGIVVTAQTERYQEQNRKYALDLLRAKLWLREQAIADAEKKEIKGEYRPAAWGTQIRSYVLHPYKMVKDLRTNVETSDAEGVLDGELDEFIEGELKLQN